MGDCLKELEETAYWIELIESEKLVTKTRIQRLKNETDQLIAIFVSSVRTTRANPDRS
jgi:four helix bundle protein